MAGGTGHAPLTEMDIRHDALILAHVLIADATAVACRACARHRWFVGENVTVEQAAAHAGRLADVAVATTRVATGAMVAKHFLHAGVVAVCPALLQDGPISFLRNMQAVDGGCRLFFVAPGANWRVALTGTSHHFSVRFNFVGGIAAAMTVNAGDLTVRGFAKRLDVDEHLFPWLQLSHRSPSANAGGKRILRFFNRRRDGDERLLVSMTGQAVAGHRF